MPIMVRTMEKNSREKIALIVFLVLAIAAGGVLFGYIFAGHSWNIAASNLDDTFGNMDGYTVIAYEGTLDEEESSLSDDSSEKASKDGAAAPDSSTAEKAKGAAGAFSSADDKLSVSDSLKQSATSSAANAEGSDAATAVGAASTAGSSGSSASAATDAADAKSADSTATPAAGASDAKAQDALPAPLAGHKKEKADVSLSDVETTYKDKGASILLLDTANPGTYSEGTIVKRGGKRYGIFSLEAETSRILIDEKVKYFADQDVDSVIAIVPDASILRGTEGIDIVVSTNDPDASKMGETKNGVFFVAAPTKGSVGAILISPSNVVSAKTISGQ